MQVAEASFGKIEVKTCKKTLNFNFSKISRARLLTAPPPHALMARTTLQCMCADRTNAVVCTRILSVRCVVQRAKVSFGKTEVQCSEKNLNSSFPKFALSICTCHGIATHPSTYATTSPRKFAKYPSTALNMSQYLKQKIQCESAAI